MSNISKFPPITPEPDITYNATSFETTSYDDASHIAYDVTEWLPYFNAADLNAVEKEEAIEALWNLVLAFVDLHFATNHTNSACGTKVDIQKVLRALMIDCDEEQEQKEQKTKQETRKDTP